MAECLGLELTFKHCCLFWVNLCVFVLGMTLAIGGLVTQNSRINKLLVKFYGYADVAEEYSSKSLLGDSTKTIASSGFFMILVGFLGCCGAWYEQRWMLILYTVILSICALMLLVVGSVALSVKGSMESVFEEAFEKQLTSKYGDSEDDAFSTSFDVVMVQLECCGATGAEEFKQTPWYQNRTDQNQKVPKACCKLSNRDAFLDDYESVSMVLADPQCPSKGPSEDNANTMSPCNTILLSWVGESMGILGTASLVGSCIMLIPVIVGCKLCCDLRDG